MAKHHILALPRKHIDNAKTVKPEDAKLSKFNLNLIKLFYYIIKDLIRYS